MNEITFYNKIAKRDWAIRQSKHKQTINAIMKGTCSGIDNNLQNLYISPPLKKYKKFINSKSFSDTNSTDNHDLLSKLGEEILKDGLLSQPSVKKLNFPKTKISLRSGAMNKEKKRITSENHRINHRLSDIKSDYSAEKYGNFFIINNRYKTNISNPHVFLHNSNINIATLENSKRATTSIKYKLKHERSISEIIALHTGKRSAKTPSI